MKHFKTFEAYVAYSDYEEKRSKWGSPADIREDLERKIMNLLQYGGIQDRLEDIEFNDQSSDKGIKWEVRIFGQKGSDTIHAYKKSMYRGEYELYLNKSKSTEYDIQQYFLDTYISALDKYIASMQSYDLRHQYADDSRAYNKGKSHADTLKKMYADLSNRDKQDAAKAFAVKHNVKVDWKTFNGVS